MARGRGRLKKGDVSRRMSRQAEDSGRPDMQEFSPYPCLTMAHNMSVIPRIDRRHELGAIYSPRTSPSVAG